MTANTQIDLSQLRSRLANSRGPKFWRSLEELADSQEFQEQLAREFPAGAEAWSPQTSRRQFLMLAGASLALAGLSGCLQQPEEKIVPYVRQPEEIIPGKPLYYATAMSQSGVATGLLVESHEGRPTKVEGNPDHPASLGATDIYQQAAVLGLYDPDRSQTILRNGQISTWDTLLTALKLVLDKQRSNQGGGLRILTETVTSPTLAAQLATIRKAFPKARWCQWEPLNRDLARRGARLAFGRDVNVMYDFSQADVVLSLDADFLISGPGHLRYARQFFGRRQFAGGPQAKSNRLYAAEVTPTLTGAKADHRLALRTHEMENLAWQLARQFGVPLSKDLQPQLGVPAAWIEAVVADLKKAGSAGLVVAGAFQSPGVHAAAHAINAQLGCVGKTVRYTKPVEAEPVDQADCLAELTGELKQGAVELLIVLGGNPAFTAPSDLKIAAALDKAETMVHLGLEANETAALADWHIPAAHFLEAWADDRAFDGTVSLTQPLIAPLYQGRTAYELLSVIEGHPAATSPELLRDHWRRAWYGDKSSEEVSSEFTKRWETCLHDGVIPETALATVNVTLQTPLAWEPPSANESDDFDLVFRPDPAAGDGRFANNGWLQELPRPLSLVTWDNPALVSPKTAEEHRLTNGQLIELERNGQSVRVPIWILPGHPDRSITLHVGNGRQRVGRVGQESGFNVYPLRTTDSPWLAQGVPLRRTSGMHGLATTQKHSNMAGRDLVRSGTLLEFLRQPSQPEFVAAEVPAKSLSLYPEVKYEGYKWGMSIDLTACLGCHACTIACQAENNIPVVGKEQVSLGREMHWIRVDRYYSGELDLPDTHFQPVPCMQCEIAPCELVCPVGATTHSPEGLNDMTYNRCVGTRYCSNNCPYKVRRFNFLHFTEPLERSPVLQLLQNPDVTVRTLGVMEKCTYCVQRINHARIDAEKEDRQITDGEVVTACQQVCPTQAIVFGDLNDPQSRVTARKQSALDYSLLAELDTRPRTTYLAEVRNPNPNLSEDAS